MKLNNDRKVRLLRSCAQVKIIELTEKIINSGKIQTDLLTNNPDLMKFVTSIYNNEVSNTISAPTPTDLIAIPLKGLKPYIESLSTEYKPQDLTNNQGDIEKNFEANLRTYSYQNLLMHNCQKALDEYKTLVDKTYGRPINIDDIKDFMDTAQTKSFTKFSKNIQKHSSIYLSSTFGNLAKEIAERNNIAGKKYSTLAERVFKAENPQIKLDMEYKARLRSAGIKIAAATTLAALLTTGTIFAARGFSKDTLETQGKEVQFVIEPIEIITDDKSSTETKTDEIFTNSIKNSETYEDACKDYFEKISDIYKYNTGKEIDLSEYGQEQIGYKPSARILLVEINGETFTFSGQGDTAPNYKYLKEALETTGATIQETSSSLSFIIDKDDSNRSIAITDSKGNSVRSGKVLVAPNNAYNPDYVKAGKEILEAQGINNPSEAECVGAYLISDSHAGDPELDKALSEVQGLTSFIKSTFSYRDGKPDSYTLDIYDVKSGNFATNFENNKKIQKSKLVTRNHDER